MRVFVVAGLVIFHSAVVFATGTSWFVKDPRPSAAFTVFLLWGSLWGMPLLFLVSGMGASHALRTRSAAAFARERLGRLLLPFAAGLVLFVPPMFYVGRLDQRRFGESYGRFWLHVANARAIAAQLLPRGSWTSGSDTFDPAHLWFLYVLLLFSITLLPVFGYLHRPRGVRLIAALAGLTDRHSTVALALAAAPLAVTESVFGPDVNSGGWERVAYLFPFIYGFVIACDPAFETALQRARWPALTAALLASTALLAWAAALDTSGINVMTGAVRGWSALQGLAGWSWLVAILGFAGSLVTRRRSRATSTTAQSAPARRTLGERAARYANEAGLPFYVLHEPVIVAAAWPIIRWKAPLLGKYLVLVVVSFATTVSLYEVLIRRFRLSRRLAGLKPADQPIPTALRSPTELARKHPTGGFPNDRASSAD
jgi:fucose 4-O-acetylase-like acetyltransferase